MNFTRLIQRGGCSEEEKRERDGIVGKVFPDSEIDRKLKENLNENPATVKRDIRAIKQWIRKQPHLAKTGKQDDHFILLVLRGSKFSLEKTKRIIEGWNTVRSLCPDLFSGWDIEDQTNKTIIKLGRNVMLSGHDVKGRRVFVQRPGRVDPNVHGVTETMRVNLMIGDVTIKNATKQTLACGTVVLVDCSGLTFGHLKQFTPAWAKKITTIFQEVYPLMPQMIHVLNLPAMAEKTLNMARGFMKEKMKRRIVVHNAGQDCSMLHEDLGIEVLPVEYGGTNGTMEEHADTMTRLMLSHREFLLEQENLKSDESKRVIVKSYSDFFGMEGSFRQLQFD